MIWCGALDDAYNRNKECEARIKEMDELQAKDPEGYIHSGHIVAGKPHWMDGEDRAAVPWMAKYTRNPYPNKVVWVQGDVNKEYFYWLGVPVKEAKKGSVLYADIDGNTVTIGDCDYSSVRIYLNEKMVDLSKPVKVVHEGKTLFEGKLTPFRRPPQENPLHPQRPLLLLPRATERVAATLDWNTYEIPPPPPAPK